MIENLRAGLAVAPATPFEFMPRKDTGELKPEKEYLSSDYMAVFYNVLGYQVRLCDLDNSYEIKPRNKNKWARLDDTNEPTLRRNFHDMGLRRINFFMDAWKSDAEENHRYHPIREYLDSLAWNGGDYIAELSGYFKSENNLFPVVFRRWLIGAVAKVFAAEQNPLLVLDGPQNIGKSHFARWLCSGIPAYYHEGGINPDNDKDDLIRLATVFIWEAMELQSTTNKADREALKGFLTRRDVRVRVPYGHYDMVKPACASFIGTINDTGGGYLNDVTGNRRFMTVTLAAIDWQYTASLDVNQLWAQAVTLYQMGETWKPTKDELALINQSNEAYEIRDPLEDVLVKFYEIDPKRLDWFTSTIDILALAHGQGWKGGTTSKAESMKLAEVMNKFKLKKGNNHSGYKGIVQRATSST